MIRAMRSSWDCAPIITKKEEIQLVQTVCQLVLPYLQRAISNLDMYALLTDKPEPKFVEAADLIQQAIETMLAAHGGDRGLAVQVPGSGR